MRSLFLAVLLASTTLAGCLTGPADLDPKTDDGPLAVDEILGLLSAPLGDLQVLHEVLDVPTRHGVLRVDLYRPDPAQLPADWKAPVIIAASPYNGPSKNASDENRMSLGLYEWLETHLVPRGYAVAHLDLLGTGSSEGCTAVMDHRERQATADVIDALGKAEWSNGKVGMIGKSYVGASQVMAAVENPEHLKTIVPISPVVNAYAYHYRNGVPYLGNQATNPLYFTYGNAAHATGLDRTVWGDGSADPSGAPDQASGIDPTCLPESWAEGANPLGDFSERWADRDVRGLVPQMRADIGVLFVHGHQDWNVKPDHFSDVWESYAVDTKMALLGQWHHDYPDNNRWDNDTHGSREDWYWLLHRWFDHFLLDTDTGLEAEVAACPVQTQASDARWHCLDHFPAETTTTMEIVGRGGAAMYAERGADTASVTGEDVDATVDRAYWTHTFENDTHVVGIPSITLPVSTTSPYNAHLVVALQVNGQEIDWALQSLRHRNGLTGEPITPGTEYEVTVDFYMLDHVFRAGDELRIEIRGHSDAPNLGVTPNPVPGVVTVDLDRTTLRLPVLEEVRVFEPLGHEAMPEGYVPQYR